jgi:integrase
MPHSPKPFFKTNRNTWYVEIGRSQHALGKHPDDLPQPVKKRGVWQAPPAILSAFYQIMATAVTEPGPPRAESTDALTVAEVYDKFLTWCRQNREALTYQSYHDFIQAFIDHLGQKALMPVAELRPFHVAEWIDRHPQWGPTRRRNAIIQLQRPFNWAHKLGYLPDNPIRHIEKPQAKRRENPVSPEDFSTICAKVRDESFRDLLTFAWETGSRPQEARHIEPRHVNLDARRIEIPPAEAKGRKRWRIIRLTDRALAIIKRLLSTSTDGKLFRNLRGRPWNRQAISCRFQRLKKKLGKRFAAYDLRHGFAERLLERGVDHLTVAELMGHANGQMIATVYQHLNKAEGHLDRVLREASEGSPA